MNLHLHNRILRLLLGLLLCGFGLRLLHYLLRGLRHHAEIRKINGVTYMNDGDWVESCTALVEHHDGKWEIVTWTLEKDNEITG